MDLYAVTTQEILERISRHCPEAMSAYIQCLNRAGNDGTVYFSKQMIDEILSEEFPIFRKNIKALAREDLLEWHPNPDGISVTLANIYDENN